MHVSRPSNVPAAALRWSIERAGIEFGLTSQTLRRSLAKTSATPDADGLFTTKQIVAAVYGAFDQEKLATQKQLTRKYEIANAIAEASVLDRSELAKVLAGIADAMVHRIMASELSRSAKQDLLHDLSSIRLYSTRSRIGKPRSRADATGRRPTRTGAKTEAGRSYASTSGTTSARG